MLSIFDRFISILMEIEMRNKIENKIFEIRREKIGIFNFINERSDLLSQHCWDQCKILPTAVKTAPSSKHNLSAKPINPNTHRCCANRPVFNVFFSSECVMEHVLYMPQTLYQAIYTQIGAEYWRCRCRDIGARIIQLENLETRDMFTMQLFSEIE